MDYAPDLLSSTQKISSKVTLASARSQQQDDLQCQDQEAFDIVETSVTYHEIHGGSTIYL